MTINKTQVASNQWADRVLFKYVARMKRSGIRELTIIPPYYASFIRATKYKFRVTCVS